MMYTLKMFYQDGRVDKFFRVTKVEYEKHQGPQSLEGDALYNHNFPLNCTIHIFTEEKNVIYSLNGIVRVEIKKEEV